MLKPNRKKTIKWLWYGAATVSAIVFYSVLGKGRELIEDDYYRYTDYVFTLSDWVVMIVAGILFFVSIEKTI